VLWNLEQHFNREARKLSKKAARVFGGEREIDTLAGQIHAYRVAAEKLMLARLGNRIRPKPKTKEKVAVALQLEEVA
jgi:hypothetical protein